MNKLFLRECKMWEKKFDDKREKERLSLKKNEERKMK